MAIQTKLGRVQGAGVFVTTVEAYSGANQQYVPRSSIFPTEDRGVKPLVGDTIIFANGIVGTISNVQSSSSIRCSANSLFSLKGKDGLNITKVEQTTTSTESGGINVVTFTLSDGSKYNVQIANGQEGGSGVDGLIVKQEGDENILYLTKADETFGEGIPLPKGGGSGGGSTNFILNPDFSVNQRGQEEYTGTQTVDCFKQNTVEGYNVKSIPTTNGIELEVSAENAEKGKALFTQTVEDAAKLEGKTVTLSVNASVTTKEGGTPVPNDGTFVENIYFNTALSADEVVSILSTLPYIDIEQTIDVSFLACKSDVSLSICAGHNKENGSYMLIDSTADDGQYWFNSATTGWNADFNGTLLFNSETIAEMEGLPIGTKNTELVNLFSITPIFSSAKGELMLGYTSKSEGSNEIGGTAVPNDGTVVESVYVNTNLTPAEVNSIIASANLTFVDYNGMPAYFMLLAGTTAIGIYNMGVGYGLGSVNLATGEMVTFFGTGVDDEYKWFDFTNPVEINAASTNNMQGLPIGEENNKLLDIFSTTPNFGSDSSSGEFIPLRNGMNSLTFEAKGLKECGIYSSANMGVETKATIHSIKLELGEEATAHLPTVTNDEKVRCQRVYQPVSLNGVVGYAKDESTLAVSIPLPVSMRAVPSVENFETISILGGAEVTAIAVDGIENNIVQLSLTTSGLTPNNLYMVSDGKVYLSADEPHS